MKSEPRVWNRFAFAWIMAILVPVFAIYPALRHPVEEHAFDAATFHVYRAVLFTDAMQETQLYPRWIREINNGLGGPLFSFYPPGAYYLMSVLNAVGLPLPVAWRVLVAVAFLLASLGMFLLSLALFRRSDIALACAACFVYAPYLLQELFERGSPQGFAIALYPWLLWALLKVARHPSGSTFAASSLLWAAIILLHHTAALLVLPVIAVVLGGLVLARERDYCVASPVLALLAGSLLCAFFLTPFSFEARYVQLDNIFGTGYAVVSLSFRDEIR
jgi:uncharacterized membrane protein